MSHKIIKVIHQWPLSKVELIEIEGKKFILKTIHKDFISEIENQKIIYNVCKKIKVPKIHSIEKNAFIMEFIPNNEKEINIEIALKTISLFHEETKSLKQFEKYDFESFYKDFVKVQKYLPPLFKKMTELKASKYFEKVFSSEYSTVHGDWGMDQILKNNGEIYVIDFGKTFCGPKILDYAHLFLKNKRIPKQVFNYIKEDRNTLIKSRTVVNIITLNWFELCKKYISYDYEKEIEEQIGFIKKNYKLIK